MPTNSDPRLVPDFTRDGRLTDAKCDPARNKVAPPATRCNAFGDGEERGTYEARQGERPGPLGEPLPVDEVYRCNPKLRVWNRKLLVGQSPGRGV